MSTILKDNLETVAHTPGRASSIGVWILQVVLAAIIAGGGLPKLAGDRSWWTCSPTSGLASGSGTWSERWRSREGLDF